MEKSIQSYCDDVISKEISGFLLTTLEVQLKEAMRNIENNKIDLASNYCSTGLSYVEICFIKGDLSRWFDSIENKSNGLKMLIDILSYTKVITDLYLNLIDNDLLEKETLRTKNIMDNLKKIIIESRKNIIIIDIWTIPQRVKSATKQNKYSSRIIDNFDGYKFINKAMTSYDSKILFEKYKNEVGIKWTEDLDKLFENNNQIV